MTEQIKKQRDFEFGDSSIAASYDNVLVHGLFTHWAESLADTFSDWRGRRVLDLATGTGVVAEYLSSRVGPGGRVIGADINDEMLALARSRCAGGETTVEFINSSAHPLQLETETVDVVVCQQGFQFFPDRPAATEEIFRVLEPGGKVILTTWCPVDECQYFGWICDALEKLKEPELAELMRAPFDYMPADELQEHFSVAGFGEIRVSREEKPFHIPGDVEDAVEVAYATPIASMLRDLTPEKQDQFRADLRCRVVGQGSGGTSLGMMASHVLAATKGN